MRSNSPVQGFESGGKLDHLHEPDIVAGQLGNNPHLESFEAHNADPRTGRDSNAGPKFIHQQSALIA
jgi:hypothetical protein